MCHVLIIEDDPLTAMDIELLLEREGATSFDFAVSEEEAVACARQARPALITSDVKLTDGSGPRAVLRITEELGPVPVIFITGSPEACAPCEPPMLVLTKPIARPAVASAFRQLVPAEG